MSLTRIRLMLLSEAFQLESPFITFESTTQSGTSVVKDPLSVDEAMDLPCVELLNESRTLIRKYPENLLCIMGLSRLIIDTDVHPTLLHDNDEEIGLLDFVKCVDPFKVKVKERTLAENEVPLITESREKVISPSLQTISLVDHTIQDKLNLNSDRVNKLPRALGLLHLQHNMLLLPLLLLLQERALEDALHDNVRARPPSGRFVVLFFGSANTDIPATSQFVLIVSSSQAGVSVPVTESIDNGRPLSAHEPETGNLSAIPSHGDAGFFDTFIINYAQHICMASELRLHYEHGLMNREKFDRKFTDSVVIVQQRDAEVFELKAKLEKSESEAVKVEELRKRVSNLEAMVAVKVGEAASLTTQNAGLLKKVFPLELERDGLKGQVIGFGSYGKAGRFLAQIEAYDPEVEGNSVDREMLLSDVVPAIRQSAERRELCPPSSSTLGGISGSASSYDSSLGVTDYHVSTLVLSSDGRPTNPPPVVQSHDDLFDTSVLEKSGDVRCF
nr:transposase (putative), gypsy type [Tanacetum cinerariifolium]